MPLFIAPSSYDLIAVPPSTKDFKGQAGAPALEVSRWSWICASCKQLNAGSRRACSYGAPWAPHQVVASGPRWTPNAIARWARGNQRGRRVSLPPLVTKVAWLPPGGKPSPPPPGYPHLPPTSIEQQQPQAQATQHQAAQKQAATTPRSRESERQQQQAQAKQRQEAATRKAILTQAQTKKQQTAQAQAATTSISSESKQQQQQVKQQQAAVEGQAIQAFMLATAASALAAAAAAAVEPLPTEDCDTESNGTFSDPPDYVCPNCSAGIYHECVSHEEVIPLLCGCGEPPRTTSN